MLAPTIAQAVRDSFVRQALLTTTLGAELTEVVNQVPGEAVIIVDQQKHGSGRLLFR